MSKPSNRFLYQMLFPLLGLCTALATLEPIDAQGATYYVATTGNDSNPGTLNQSFKSFKKGIDVLQPGDTLFIRGGTYTEQMDFQGPQKSGTPSGWLRIAGFPGETITLRWTDPKPSSYGPIKARGNRGYFIFENLILDGVNDTNDTSWAIRDGNHHFVLRNLEIKNFKKTGLFITASNVQVINCKIHDQVRFNDGRLYGIYYSKGDNVLIEGNEIYNNPGGGIHVFPGPINNSVIRNNVIHHNNYMENSAVPGITIFQDVDYYDGTAKINNVQVYNNLVYSNCVDNPERSCGGIQVSNGATNTRVWNNTVYGNKGYGILVNAGSNGPPVNTAVQNNIVFANTSSQIIDSGVDSIITHNLTTDPKFVKVDAFNFRLQAHSPAIDAGAALDMVRSDIKDVARPQGAAHDIGAFEGSASDSDSLNAPKELSLK